MIGAWVLGMGLSWAGGTTVTLELPQRPTSRVVCHLTQRASANEAPVGEERLVVFDPQVSATTVASAVLGDPGENRSWFVRCDADPLVRAVAGAGGVSTPLDLGWRFSQTPTKVPATGQKELMPLTFVEYGLAGSAGCPGTPAGLVPCERGASVVVYTSTVKKPELSEARKALANTPPAAGGPRAFGATPPDLVLDTLDILADLAVKRAKQGAFEAVAEQMTWLVCGDLAFSADMTDWFEGVAAGDPILPETCGVVREMSLEQLASIGEALSQALKADLVDRALRLVAKIPGKVAGEESKKPDPQVVAALKTTLELVRPLLTELVRRDGRMSGQEVALALIGGARTAWKDIEGVPKEARCAGELTFAIVGQCFRDGAGCDAARIAGWAAAPWDQFDLGESACAGFDESKEAAWRSWGREVGALAVRVHELASPDPDATPRDLAIGALDLGFDLARLLATKADGGAHGSEAMEWISAVEGLALGAAREDLFAVVSSGTSLLRRGVEAVGDCSGKAPKKAACAVVRTLDRVSPIVAALASNATSLKQAAENPEDAEALRAAREQTIESLVDQLTSRRGREGDVIVSVGAMVGMHAAVGYSVDDKSREPESGLSLPMGIAVDYLERPKSERAWTAGFHLQLTAIDLGYFLTWDEGAAGVDETLWTSFLAPGLDVGLAFGRAHSTFVVGPYLRYRPGENELAVGGQVAFYVPFADLN